MHFATARDSRPGIFATIAICALAGLALMLGQVAPAAASTGADTSASSTSSASGQAKRGKASKSAARKRALRRQRARQRRLSRIRRTGRSRNTRLSSNVALSHRRKKAAAGDSSGVIDAGFENGLDNWNTAGVGTTIPAVTSDLVRSGAGAGRFVLTGAQERSELILGGNGGGSANDTIRFYEGAEAYYAFSFYIESMVYGKPGGHNLIMQLKGDDDGSPNFALQLWNYEGDDGESGGRGLWSHSEAMDGDRYLAPAAEHQWHDVVVHFKASGSNAGFYEVYLDGRWWPMDARHGKPRVGRVLMARGRDAADVALITSFGRHRLTKFTVVTDEVQPATPPSIGMPAPLALSA